MQDVTYAANRAVDGAEWTKKTLHSRRRESVGENSRAGDAGEQVREGVETEAMKRSRRFPVPSGELSFLWVPAESCVR